MPVPSERALLSLGPVNRISSTWNSFCPRSIDSMTQRADVVGIDGTKYVYDEWMLRCDDANCEAVQVTYPHYFSGAPTVNY